MDAEATTPHEDKADRGSKKCLPHLEDLGSKKCLPQLQDLGGKEKNFAQIWPRGTAGCDHGQPTQHRRVFAFPRRVVALQMKVKLRDRSLDKAEDDVQDLDHVRRILRHVSIGDEECQTPAMYYGTADVELRPLQHG